MKTLLDRFMWMAPLAPLAVVLLCGKGCSAASCVESAEMTGRKTEYKMISGCFIEVNGRMVPLDSWRGEESRE